MALNSTSYRIIIDGSAAPTVAPNNGFIDNKSLEKYLVSESGTSYSVSDSMAKKRANIRYQWLIQQLHAVGTLPVFGIVQNGTLKMAPTSFQFDIFAEQGDSILTTIDETDGTTVLKGIDCLKRLVARSLVISRTQVTDWYDPTPSTTPTNSVSYPRRLYVTDNLTVGPIAASLTAATTTIGITKL